MPLSPKALVMLLSRRLTTLAACLAASALVGGALVAQLESGERGILPIDSSGTLEITGIHVDVGGKEAESARFAGWRMAQREGFKMLWAKQHGRPASQAPNLSDSTLAVDAENLPKFVDQVAALKTPADLGVLFDRYAVRRTDPRFWTISDRMHDDWQARDPVEFGILDYSRLNNH